MKQPSGKTGKSMLPRMIFGVMLFGCLLFLAPLLRGYFFKERPPEVKEERPGGAILTTEKFQGRHKILDRGYRELAVSFMMNSLYGRPLEITDHQATSRFLAEQLGLDEKDLLRDLRAERGFVWLGRRLPESVTAPVVKKAIKGIYLVKEAQRFYPAGQLAAHVLGFLDGDNGLAGVEFHYDQTLSGVGRGEMSGEGGHLVLTLDLRMQRALENRLGELLRDSDGQSATAILMDYRNGAILAMASIPGYDPNGYWNSGKEERRNRALADNGGYEEWRRLFGYAAAQERQQAAGAATLAALKSDLQLASHPAGTHDRSWLARNDEGWQSPELRIWTADQLENGGLEPDEFLRKIGIFAKTGIDLPEDDPGQAGQASPLQLLNGFATMVNGGSRVVPHLGEAVLDWQSGRRFEIEQPIKTGVISPETSRKLVGILEGVSLSGKGQIFLESMRPQDNALEEQSPADHSEKSGNAAAEVVRFQTMMLGFAPHQAEGLAMLVALTGAVVDPGRKTPMRSMGEKLLGEAVKLAGEVQARPGSERLASSEAKIYEDWLRAHYAPAERQSVPRAKEQQTAMPDLRGLSARKALRSLEGSGLKIKVVGAGRIVAQLPPPGSVLTGGECVLTLQSDN